jgi:glycosyltransferase involved in cell wall biosynthesis
MRGSPAVSVVTSVHDGERYLAAALDSVLGQTFADFELVVVDDGSTDSSPEILADYAAGDKRVIVLQQENAGLARALNRGVASARSPLIARLDADDIALPRRLEVQLAYLDENPGVGLVGGAVKFVDADDREFAATQYPLADAEIREAFTETTPFVHSAITMRRTAFEEAGGYRPAFPHAEDLDLWLRIAAGWQLANLPDAVVRYRIHPGQSTVTELEQQSLSALGARIAWRARASGRPDPFEHTELVDRSAVVAAGATEEEITGELVRLSVWLAKTIDRSGRDDLAAEVFDLAAARAASASGSRELVALVRRERAKRLRERGRTLSWLRTRVSAALAR